MEKRTSTFALAGLLVAILVAPGTLAESAFISDTFVGEPVEIAQANCSGVAPLPPRCDTWFTAYSYVQIGTSGAFNGQIECRINSPNFYYRLYTMQVVAGLTVSYTVSGPGLTAGYIHAHCETKGPFGAGGSNGGIGYFVVTFTYA